MSAATPNAAIVQRVGGKGVKISIDIAPDTSLKLHSLITSAFASQGSEGALLRRHIPWCHTHTSRLTRSASGTTKPQRHTSLRLERSTKSEAKWRICAASPFLTSILTACLGSERLFLTPPSGRHSRSSASPSLKETQRDSKRFKEPSCAGREALRVSAPRSKLPCPHLQRHWQTRILHMWLQGHTSESDRSPSAADKASACSAAQRAPSPWQLS